MAVRARNTGAPTRAPSNVIPFPHDETSRLRLRLARCTDLPMLARWADDFRKTRDRLPDRARGQLAGQYAIVSLRMEGIIPAMPETAA